MIANILDRFIDMLKWPFAILSLLSIPALLQSFNYFEFMNVKYLSMGIGFFMFYISRTMAKKSIKTTMQILAHELTHTFFALITFHKVTELNIAADNSGGKMKFEGKGNWLIVIAPYFFPLMAFAYVIATTIYLNFFPAHNTMYLILNGFLGYFLAYHCDTIVSQIHPKQTDFPIVGFPFCITFIPGANLWAVGNILAFNSLGWTGIAKYHGLIHHLNMNNLIYLKNLLFL